MKRMIFSVAGGSNRDAILLVVRIAIGSLMLVHGLPKLEALLSDGPVQFPHIFGMGPALSLALAAFAEVFCSVFIVLGMGTRVATIPLIITMLVAVFHVHASDPFIKQEMGLHYLLVYGILLFEGSGKYSADNLVARQRAT